jgi:hypothetical protein
LPFKKLSTNTLSIDVWRLEHSNETLIIDFGNREMGTTFELEILLTTTIFHFATNLKHVSSRFCCPCLVLFHKSSCKSSKPFMLMVLPLSQELSQALFKNQTSYALPCTQFFPSFLAPLDLNNSFFSHVPLTLGTSFILHTSCK